MANPTHAETLRMRARFAAHETEIEGGRCRTDGPSLGESSLTPLLLVVGGPDKDDEIVLLASGECYLPRETARALAGEILRRLEASRG